MNSTPTLSDDDVKKLKAIIRKDSSPKTVKCRCQILLNLASAHAKPSTHEQAAKSNSVCNGSRIIHEHDAQYRNTKTTYEDGTSEAFNYNDKSLCTSRTDRNGITKKWRTTTAETSPRP